MCVCVCSVHKVVERDQVVETPCHCLRAGAKVRALQAAVEAERRDPPPPAQGREGAAATAPICTRMRLREAPQVCAS